MAERTTPQEFLEQVAARDYQRLASTLAIDARARMLLLGGPEEHRGRAAVVRCFENWFGTASAFDLMSSREEVVGRRHRVHWRFSLKREGRGREVVDQTVFLDLGPDGIEQIDLLCSGFQAEPEAAGGSMQLFDAGDMGCSDGLAQEFRRRIGEVGVGSALEVVVSDPAAREDLPSLARLLGHQVISAEARDDGRLAITVERRK